MSEVIPRLFVSGAKHALMHGGEYELVVNCTGGDGGFSQPHNELRLPVRDTPEDADALVQCMEDTKVLDVMRSVLQGGHKVLVHCWLGVQRSPAVAACFLVRHHGCTPAQAVAWLRAQRPGVFEPRATFERTICRVYESPP